MKSKNPTEHKPHDWSQSGRPIQPYRIDPVTIAIDQEDTEDQDLADPTTRPYLKGPIYAELLKLGPGLSSRFVTFATNFGLHGFTDWAMSAAENELVDLDGFDHLIAILERYNTGFRRFTLEELLAAWDSLSDAAVRIQTQALHDAFTFAARSAEDDDPSLAVRGVLRRAWEIGVLRIDVDLDQTSAVPVIYERPRDIWARAWFELIEDLRAGRHLKTCALCSEYFVPRRRNKAYCSDPCRNRAYDKKRSNDPKRREDKRATYLKNKSAAQAAPESLQEPQGGDQ